MKAIKRMVIPVLLVLMLCSIGILFVGCEEEEKEAVFEIRLYDDNWVELEKEENFYKTLTFEYDGRPKGVNVKCFMDDEVFYTYEYLMDKIPINFPLTEIINCVSSPPNATNTQVSKIIEKGKYLFFVEFKPTYTTNNFVYKTESGKTLSRSDLPNDVWRSVTIYVI